MTRPLAVALAALATGVAWLPSSAMGANANPDPHGATFAGQCQFTGTSTFSSPVTAVPSPVRNQVTASGTCSGSLTTAGGRTTQLSNAPVGYQASEAGSNESCESDLGAAGTGELLFQSATIRFNVAENRVGGDAALKYTGRRGGSAAGVAFVTASNPAALLQQCTGSGLSSSPVEIVLQTTPSLSG